MKNSRVSTRKKSLNPDFKRQRISSPNPGIFDREPFDIRDYHDRLTPTKRKHRYECPVCGGHSFTINPKTGAYKCWSNECDSKDIREAIAPELFNSSNSSTYSRRKFKRKPKPPAPTPAPIPTGDIELAQLPNSPTPEPKINRGRYTEIKYPYSPTQWVLRKQNPNGKKITLPYHTTSTGKCCCGKGDEKWQPYRWNEVLQYGVGKWVLGVEGEKDTDNSRIALQIVTFTFQGGSWGDDLLLSVAFQIKDAGVAGIIYLPDNDDAGRKKAEKLANACALAKLPFIAINPVRLWQECPHKGDISDWIDSGKARVESLNQEIATAQGELLKPKNKVFSSQFVSERDTRNVGASAYQEIIEETSARLNKLRKKIFRSIANPIRHITPKVKRRTKKPNVLTYVPGELPFVEDWKKQGKPKIQFTNASDRKQLIQEAIGKGYSEILDNSHPGLGKSYSAGEFTPSDFGVDKLIYQDVNHRNASTSTVEDNFADIPVRNNGYKIDYTRATPSGQPYLIRTKPGESPDTQSGCHRTYLFDAFRNKNYNDAFSFEESAVSPICQGCPLENQCKYSSGDGYGFRFQKRTVINDNTRLRSHPDTAPIKIYKNNNGDGEKETYTIARIWEEAGVSIKGASKVEVTLKDFDHTVSEVALKTPEVFEILKPIFEVLRELLNKEIKSKSKYGLSNKELVELLEKRYSSDGKDLIGELVQLTTGGGLIALQAIWRPNLDFLAEKDGIDCTDKELKVNKSLRWANRELEKAGAREAGKEFLELPLFWLVDFIKALIGHGSIRYERGKLNIYKRNIRHRELASNAEFNLYLDATLTPEILQNKLGINEPILVIQQAPPEYNNLKIVQVTGLGKLGKQRSLSLENRVEALKIQLKNNHPDLKILEWKALASDGEFNHFSDGRGVNRFENTSAIASFGIPYQNIGELAAHYQVQLKTQSIDLFLKDGDIDKINELADRSNSIDFNNPNNDFQQYVEQLTQAEIVQEIGRLRANRRSDEELTFYFCADYDLSFLAEHFPGATREKVDAFAITPDAGTQNQQTKLTILEAAKELTNRGNKLTQKLIANLAEITQGTVSKIASQFGGWASLKKLFQTLLDSLYSDWNISDGTELDSEEKEYVPGLIEYLPTLASPQISVLEAVGALVEVLEVMGKKVFRAILHNLDPATRGKLLGKILPCDCAEAAMILDLVPR